MTTFDTVLSRIRLRWLVFILLLVFSTLYGLTLTNVHTFDALSYILDVDRKPWSELFHPHHLLYGPFGAVIRALATGIGWQGSVAVWLQFVNAIAGAIGVTILFVVCRAVTRSTGAALIASTGMGFSYAYWYYAVEVEVYTLAVVALIAGLWLMFGIVQTPTWQLSAWLGLVHGFAVLGHQTNVLFAVPALLTIGLSIKTQQLRYQLGVAYLLPLVAVVGSAYLWVAFGVSGMRSWSEVWTWLTGYAQTGFWGGAIDQAKLTGLLKGWSETLALQGGAVIGISGIVLLLAGRSAFSRLPRPLLIGVLSWLIVYGLFFLWWEPDNIEFWIASLPPLALLFSAVLTIQWIYRAGLALVIVMLVLNLPTIIERGDPNRDLQRRIAESVAAITQAGDLIIVPDGVLELYLPYYWGHDNVYGLNQAMIASNGDWSAACARIQQRIETVLAAGYAVLIADEAQRPLPAPPGQPPTPAERFGLTAEMVSACYAPIQSMLQMAPLPADLPVYRFIPRANVLAGGEGWDFRRGHWGWRAEQVESERITPSGWHIIPGIDPRLNSPPLLLSSADIVAVEVKLAATTNARDAQIFFLDLNGQAREERSISFTLVPGTDMTTYRLPFNGIAEQMEKIGGIRFDPVSAGDGGTIIVESIRLIFR